MTSVGVTRLRDAIPEVIDRVRHGGERILVERHGKPVAVIVSLEDLRLLEELEDRADLEEIRRVLSDPNEKWLSLEEAEAGLDL